MNPGSQTLNHYTLLPPYWDAQGTHSLTTQERSAKEDYKNPQGLTFSPGEGFMEIRDAKARFQRMNRRLSDGQERERYSGRRECKGEDLEA